MMICYLYYFFQSVGDFSLCICYMVHAQRAMHAVVLPPYNPVINQGGILEKRIINRGNSPKQKSTAMKQKVRILKMKFEIQMKLLKIWMTIQMLALPPLRDSRFAAREI